MLLSFLNLFGVASFVLPEVLHVFCQACECAVTYNEHEFDTTSKYFCKMCGDCTYCGDTFFDFCIELKHCHCSNCVKQKGCRSNFVQFF